MSQRVVVTDLGMGNLRSVARALERSAAAVSVEVEVVVSADPAAVARADRIVVPGQGAFRDAAHALEGGFGDALRDAIARGVPYLGICLGLQLLFEASDEAPGAKGLGVLAGSVVRLSAEGGVKIPHMGWNALELLDASKGTALEALRGREAYVYFVHSYHAAPADRSVVAAVARHGTNLVTAAVARGNVLATQFHPEKSQREGERLLGAFLSA